MTALLNSPLTHYAAALLLFVGLTAALLAAQLQIAVLAGQTLAGTIAALLHTSVIMRTPVLPLSA